MRAALVHPIIVLGALVLLKMLPLKILKKQVSYNVLNACFKRPKEFSHPSSAVLQSNNPHGNDSHTINAISSYWRHRFETEGVPQPMESVEHIISHVIGDKDTHRDKELNELQLAKLEMLCHQRLRLVPLEFLTGESEFGGNKLKLSAPFCIPERQTEMLVDLLLKHIARSCSEVCTVLEIGCGVGAISLSLLLCCDSVQVVAIDTNIVACELTLYNAQNLNLIDRLTILNATLEDNGSITFTKNLSNEFIIDLQEKNFDFVVSNPPCTPIDEVPDWQKEFQDSEPRNGEKDGLKVIRPLLEYASNKLKNQGVLLLEVFKNQSEKIKSIIEEDYMSKLSFDHVYKDLCNDEHIVEVTKIE